MGIVGTVDSAYKAIGVEIPGIDGAAMAAAAEIALESGTLAEISPIWPSAGVRRPASCRHAPQDSSMQRGRWRCGSMGDERHEAQVGAAARAAVCGRGALEAREKLLDGERLGLNDGRLAERGACLIQSRTGALAVQAVAAHRLQSGLGQVREIAGEECVWIERHDHERAAGVILIAVRPVAKAHAAGLDAQQLGVLQRPALEITREVRGHALAVGVAGADVHVPLLASEPVVSPSFR